MLLQFNIDNRSFHDIIYRNRITALLQRFVMIVNLQDVAKIQMGYSFRTRLESSPEGTIGVIQMKDLLDDNTVNINGVTKMDMLDIKEQHLASQGDLIFRSRGLTPTSAIVIDSPEKTVIAAPLLRIRIASKLISPEYLNWYISQHDAQSYFKRMAKGSSGKMISKQVLGELKIPIPPMETQIHIAEIASLLLSEQILLKEILKKRNQYISSVLMKFAKGE